MSRRTAALKRIATKPRGTYGQSHIPEKSCWLQLFQPSGDQTCEKVAQGGGDEPDTHHLSDSPSRGELRHRGKPHGR